MTYYRNQSLERDLSQAQQEIVQLKSVIERLRLDKAELDEQLNEVSVQVIKTFMSLYFQLIIICTKVLLEFCFINFDLIFRHMQL